MESDQQRAAEAIHLNERGRLVLNITAVTCPESFSGRENNTTLKKLHFVLFVFILQRELWFV